MAVTNKELPVIVRYIARTTGPRAGERDLAVFYDADCAFCSSCARLLRRLDLQRRLRLVPLADAAARRADAPPVEVLLQTMHVVDDSGRWTQGADACREIAWRVPLLAPLAALTALPGMRALARQAYAVVARQRPRIGAALGTTACDVRARR